MADLPQAYVVHETPTRLRLKVPSRRHDKSYFGNVLRALSEKMPGARIDANPTTATILISGPDSRRIVSAADADVPFRVLDEAPRTFDLQAVALRFQTFDRRLLALSAGRLDARSFVVLGLVASAMIQISRGRIFAPAVTLLWYAGEAVHAWTLNDPRR
jgi:ABC-type amino acid transport substrate-binding protein